MEAEPNPPATAFWWEFGGVSASVKGGTETVAGIWNVGGLFDAIKGDDETGMKGCEVGDLAGITVVGPGLILAYMRSSISSMSDFEVDWTSTLLFSDMALQISEGSPTVFKKEWKCVRLCNKALQNINSEVNKNSAKKKWSENKIATNWMADLMQSTHFYFYKRGKNVKLIYCAMQQIEKK